MDDSPMNDAPYSIEKGGSNQSNTAKTWQGGPLSNDRAGNVSKSAQVRTTNIVHTGVQCGNLVLPLKVVHNHQHSRFCSCQLSVWG